MHFKKGWDVLCYGGNRNKNFLFISKDQNIFLLNAEFLQIKVLVQKNLHYHNYTWSEEKKTCYNSILTASTHNQMY